MSNQPSTAPAGTSASEPIAVVGMACRFPGANTLDAFWRNLAAGACHIREVPAERWDREAYYSRFPEDHNKSV
ncbi:MAG: beta-ketoacyl synthase N-terminal-like domain-containing protein, partial [Gammaproteobacteria bacterium]